MVHVQSCCFANKTYCFFFFDVLVTVRVDKQQRRRRLRKRHLKSEFALIPARVIRQMLANFSGFEFQRTVSKFRKTKTKSSSCVHVLQKTWNQGVPRRSRAVTAKKCTKKRGARAKLLFCQSKPIALFCRSRCRRRRLCLFKLPIGRRGVVHETVSRFWIFMGWHLWLYLDVLSAKCFAGLL